MNPSSRKRRNDRRTVLSLTPRTSAILVAVTRPFVSITLRMYSSVLVISRRFAAATERSLNVGFAFCEGEGAWAEELGEAFEGAFGEELEAVLCEKLLAA